MYVSDSLFQYAQQKRLTVRFIDLIDGSKKETKTAEQIIAETIKKGGLRLKGEADSD